MHGRRQFVSWDVWLISINERNPYSKNKFIILEDR